MNFEQQKIKLAQIRIELKKCEKYYEAEEIGAIMGCAMIASKIDMRHARGILDRLLKRPYCTYLIKQEENAKNEK